MCLKSALFVHELGKLDEIFSEKMWFLSIFLDFEQKNFKLLPESFGRNFEKHSTCREDYLQSNFFEWDYSKN